MAHTPIYHIIFWKTVIRIFRPIYVNCFNRLRFLRSAQNYRKWTFLDNLRTITHEGSMETRQITPFSHLLFLFYYFKISPPFSAVLFSEKYLNPQARINKMVNKYTVDYHPCLSQSISTIHTLIFLWTPKGFISPESFLNFFLNLYIPPWLWKSFKVIVLRLLQYICESKNWICSFLIMPPSKTLMELKELPKLTKVSVTSFDKFHHLCNLYIFGLCFVVQ